MEKRQEKYIVIGIVTIIFLLSSVVGYSFLSENNSNEFIYNGSRGDFNFSKSPQGDYWLSWTSRVKISEQNVYRLYDHITPFAYGPSELEDIPVKAPGSNIRNAVKKINVVYITRDVNLDSKYSNINSKGGMTIALLTLDRIINKFGVKKFVASIESNELSKELELPVIGCENADKFRSVIWIKEGEDTRIFEQIDNCIVAQFKEGEDPTRVATKLAYIIIGVM